MKGYLIFICLVICGSLISGCTTSAPSSKDTSSVPQVTTSVPTGPTAIVVIRARSFDPSTITIKEGTSVTWKNEETIVRHVVHLPDVRQMQLFDSGPLSPMESYTYTFSEKGRFNYGDPQIGGGRTYMVIVE
jgi:plastocyanin